MLYPADSEEAKRYTQKGSRVVGQAKARSLRLRLALPLRGGWRYGQQLDAATENQKKIPTFHRIHFQSTFNPLSQFNYQSPLNHAMYYEPLQINDEMKCDRTA